MQPIHGLGNGLVIQVCLIVDDAEKYALRYSEVFGMKLKEPQITDGYADTEAEYYGEPTEAKAKIYNWRFGNVEFEILQPLGPKSVWQDWLDQHGNSIHHVAFAVTDSHGVAKEFLRHGYPVSQQGFYTGRHPNGGHTGMYTYLDTDKVFGMTVELLESFSANGEVR